MAVESLLMTFLWIIIAVAVIAAFAWLADYIIAKYFPPPAHMIARVFIGVILLILLVYAIIHFLPRGAPWR